MTAVERGGAGGPGATRPLRVVAVSGSLHAPSKTTALLAELVAALDARIDIVHETFTLTELGPGLAGALTRADLDPDLESVLGRIERADVLVVASPVYRAAVSGLFKHVFDLVDQHALAGTPVLVAATGGSERHALVLEHHLRPLFSFFQAVTLPLGVYGCESDFDGARVTSESLRRRIDRAVERGIPLIRHLTSAESRKELLDRIRETGVA